MKTLKGKIWFILCGVVLVICAVVMVLAADPDTGQLPRNLDKEFDHGSGIVLDDATDFQKDSLYKLAKVWGYVKYRHPDIIAGQINWDAELFRVMPKVLQAADEEAVNAVLLDWLNQFPFEQATAETARYYQTVQETFPGTENDMSWISDREFLGERLCTWLETLSNTHAGDWTYAYAFWDGSSESSGGLDFSNETNWSYTFSADDVGMRLLGAFRFWNAYEYFSPNVDITRMDWDQALRNAIDEPERRATYGAVLSIIALIDVPICFMVTRLIPSSIHPVVVREGGMSADMGITLMFCLVGIMLIGFALYRFRFRQVRLTERVEALKEQLED